MRFHDRARLARAWLAIEDPEAEKTAASPLSEDQAWQIITDITLREKAKPDSHALRDALGIPSDRNKGRLVCPAHGEGKKLSLSWRVTEDDRLLLHCFAGCTFEEIRRAVGQ